MVDYVIPNVSAGFDNAMVDMSSSVSSFFPSFLVFIWFFVFLGGYMAQKARGRDADAPVWAVMASLTTFMVALLLSIKPGIISLPVLSTVVGILILSAIWLFLGKGSREI